MLGRLARSVVPTQLARSVVRRVRPGLVNHRLTETPVVQALCRATEIEAVVAVYDDGGAPYATPETLERELDVIVSSTRNLALPSIPAHSFAESRRTIRAVTLTESEPPVVLLSRRSLENWNEETRNFVLGHEFGHLLVESSNDWSLDSETATTRSGNPADLANVANSADSADVAESLLPAPDQSALAIRALVAAHREFRAGEAHAEIRADLPESHRPPASVMAEYHSVERASQKSALLSSAERRALEIRNAAKYLALPYDPPEIEEKIRTALARPLPKYLDWVIDSPLG